MAVRIIKLRWPSTCHTCNRPLAAGDRAAWDDQAKRSFCGECIRPTGPLPAQSAPEPPSASTPAVDAPVPPPPSPLPPPPAPLGVPGAAARRIAEQKAAKRQEDIRSRHPRLGEFILATSEEPQSTRAWQIGAAGEEHLGNRLNRLKARGVITMHDQRIPGSRANIDHLAVTPSGVWIIDAKKYRGKVERRDMGGWRSTTWRLYVSGRDKSSLIEGMGRQRDAVLKSLAALDETVPIHQAICFIDADWSWLTKPFDIDDVLVTWPTALLNRMVADGPLEVEHRRAVLQLLQSNFRPA